MPRTKRKKSSDANYHIMSRSISEVDLFRCDEDKDYYLKLLKQRIDKYHCKIYAYCLMSNHSHFYINPCGADISTFMLSLNTAYVSYYNKKYNRHGHLFQGRFASTIIDSDPYSLTLSAYIHNNAKDIPGYRGREELYRYPSYGIYTGHRKDVEELLDTGFILSSFSEDPSIAKGKYRNFTDSLRDTEILGKVDEKIVRAYTENEYKSEKQFILRYDSTDELLEKINKHLNENIKSKLRIKYSRETSSIRAFTTYLLRILCGFSYRETCEFIGNMSMSGVCRLSNEGYKLYKTNKHYQDVFDFLTKAA